MPKLLSPGSSGGLEGGSAVNQAEDDEVARVQASATETSGEGTVDPDGIRNSPSPVCARAGAARRCCLLGSTPPRPSCPLPTHPAQFYQRRSSSGAMRRPCASRPTCHSICWQAIRRPRRPRRGGLAGRAWAALGTGAALPSPLTAAPVVRRTRAPRYRRWIRAAPLSDDGWRTAFGICRRSSGRSARMWRRLYTCVVGGVATLC